MGKELTKRFDNREVLGNDLSGYNEEDEEQELDSIDGVIDE